MVSAGTVSAAIDRLTLSISGVKEALPLQPHIWALVTTVHCGVQGSNVTLLALEGKQRHVASLLRAIAPPRQPL
jgi:hypothetical protein